MSQFTEDIKEVSNYKKGLDLLRERFKECKFNNNYDGMCDAIENIKSEIKSKLIAREKKDIIKKIEIIVNWYRTKEVNHTQKTPNGYEVIFPPDMNFKVNKNLTVAYEILIAELERLDLL